MIDPLDFFDLESLLSEEERAVRDSVRRWVESSVRPRIADAWRRGEPLDLLSEMGALGILGGTLEGYGAPGLGAVAYGLAMRELERADSCVRSMAGVQSNLSMYPIASFGSDEQKEEWLPSLASGERSGCFALTEPDAGSDPGSMRTRAVETSTGWRVSGVKRWITNGTRADVVVLWARTGDDARSIRGFLVETDRPGLSREKIAAKQSFRASDTAELVFDEVEIPKAALLPKSRGLKSALEVLGEGRFGIAWGVLGAAEDCLRVALEFTSSREAFGKMVAGHQLTQARLARMSEVITHGQLLAWRLGRMKERDEALAPARLSMAKMSNARAALEVARTSREMLGANGIMDEYGVMRHMCNLETVVTYEGTHEVHQLVVGQALTGLSAF